jgi:putative membrane protein
MRTIWISVSAGLLLWVAAASGQSQTANHPNLSDQDQQFATMAAQANVGEVQLGKLAERSGSSDAVKQFGKLMVKDHSRAQDNLRSWASSSNFMLPGELGPEAMPLKNALSAISGKQFDRAYIQEMLQGHKKVIAAFEAEIEHGQDASLKQYASSVLPVIQDHIRIAEDIAGKMNMSGGKGLSDESKAILAQSGPKAH